jgi:peroxiredoxin
MSGLSPGQRAPEIDAVASDGRRFVLSQQQGLCTVVYFFPKAFTPGCTVETKLFRDNYVELVMAGATLVGISTDDLDTQCKFAASTRASFPIVPDPDLKISREFGVLWPVVHVARRVTFVVRPDMTIDAVFHHEVQISRHRDDVLRHVNVMFKRSRFHDDAHDDAHDAGHDAPPGGAKDP